MSGSTTRSLQLGPHRHRAFTLIELLAVIAVIAMLFALLLPAIQRARESARMTQCRNNLKQLGLAMHNYHNVFSSFPAGGYANLRDGFFQAGTLVALLPFLEQSNLADTFSFNLGWEDPANHGVARSAIATFICPSASQANPGTSETWQDTITSCPYIDWPLEVGVTNYLISKGPNDSWCLDGVSPYEAGVFELNQPNRVADVVDGTSNTLCMGEGSCGPRWYICELGNCPAPATNPENGEVFHPVNPWVTAELITTSVKDLKGMVATSSWGTTQRPMNQNPVIETFASQENDGEDLLDCRASGAGGPHSTSGFRSDHVGGVMFLLSDGSVQFLSESVNMDVYQALSIRAGGEAVLVE